MRVTSLSAFSICLLLILACAPAQEAPATPVPPTEVPAPTATPADLPEPEEAPEEVASVDDLGAVPETWDDLEVWLSEAWALGVRSDDVHNALLAAGWQYEPTHWRTADLDGDGRNEWLVTLVTSSEEITWPWGPFGDFWIVNQDGVVYRFSEANAAEDWAAPTVLDVVDMTGDGLVDVITVSTFCGAHTCFDLYHVLSAHEGPIGNIAATTPDMEGWHDGISMAYPEAQVYDATGDGLANLVITGGIIGSAGAGIQRERTEVWGWDGTTISLLNMTWAASNYRFHALYDGNFAFEDGDYERARRHYLRVIEDETLEDVDWRWDERDDPRADSRQFAAFRLALLDLLAGDVEGAMRWRNWLLAEYREASLTAAAGTLIAEWQETGDVAVACAAVTNQLLDAERPTGTLEYMGYANPAIEAEDVCPLR